MHVYSYIISKMVNSNMKALYINCAIIFNYAKGRKWIFFAHDPTLDEFQKINDGRPTYNHSIHTNHFLEIN